MICDCCGKRIASQYNHLCHFPGLLDPIEPLHIPDPITPHNFEVEKEDLTKF